MSPNAPLPSLRLKRYLPPTRSYMCCLIFDSCDDDKYERVFKPDFNFYKILEFKVGWANYNYHYYYFDFV